MTFRGKTNEVQMTYQWSTNEVQKAYKWSTNESLDDKEKMKYRESTNDV